MGAVAPPQAKIGGGGGLSPPRFGAENIARPAKKLFYQDISSHECVQTSSKLPWKSSGNFVYFRKSLGNDRKRSYGLRTTIGESSEFFNLETAQKTKKLLERKKVLQPKTRRVFLGQS